MTPGKMNFMIYQGATFDQTIVWKAGNTPVDLTNAKARLQVRKNAKATDILLEMTTENGKIEIPAGAEGKINFLLSATDTSALTFSEGEYHLEVELPDGKVRRLLVGTIAVDPELTR